MDMFHITRSLHCRIPPGGPQPAFPHNPDADSTSPSPGSQFHSQECLQHSDSMLESPFCSGLHWKLATFQANQEMAWKNMLKYDICYIQNPKKPPKHQTSLWVAGMLSVTSCPPSRTLCCPPENPTTSTSICISSWLTTNESLGNCDATVFQE